MEDAVDALLRNLPVLLLANYQAQASYVHTLNTGPSDKLVIEKNAP
jgi:hypothetical protein